MMAVLLGSSWCLPVGAVFELDDVSSAESCQSWMSDYNADQLGRIVKMNCDKVELAIEEWDQMQNGNSPEQVHDWEHRGLKGLNMCKEAQAKLKNGHAWDAAHLAVAAFGTGIMQNHLCCTRLTAPNCVIPIHHTSAFTFRTPAGILLCAFVLLLTTMCFGSCIDSCVKRSKAEQRGEEQDSDDFGPPVTSGGGGLMSGSSGLARELQHEWMQTSPLRVLPGADAYARSASTLFSALHAAFEFQTDSVKNQYEHFMSMLLSHCATVADRFVEDGQVDEQSLLSDALDDLHCELMEGFVRWRGNYRECAGSGMDADAAVPPAGGISWTNLPAQVCKPADAEQATERSRQMVEIATYLLVWGEGGNIRFMPEVVYFLTELALASEGPGASGFYGAGPVGSGHSGRFLSRIIRPLYTLVFDEWYQKVEINAKGGDSKVLHKDFTRFLLPDVANYDDWNEFFDDPRQVVDGLLLTNGSSLFDLPHGQRFASLPSVHWTASLKGSQIKTHREVHSMIGVFAATHRVWLLHAVLFCLAVCVAVGDPPEDLSSYWMDRALLGDDTLVRFAAVGLLVPIHALLWTIARMETTSNNVLKKSCGCCFCLESVFWAVLWAAPLVTYAAVRVYDWVETNEQQEAMRTMALAAHFSVSALGLFFLLFAPAKKADKLFKTTHVPFATRFVRYFFWFVILAIKFLLGIVIFSAVYSASEQLQFINLGHETSKDVAGLWRSSHWGANFYEWALLWAMAFYMFCADTAMWFQVGCMFLGVGIVFVQRGCRLCSFCMSDAVAQIPERFSRIVFKYAPKARASDVAAVFPDVWDRIVAYLRYEDKCESDAMWELSFSKGSQNSGLSWKSLSLANHPITPKEKLPKGPDLFEGGTPIETFFKNYCGWKASLGNADLKWRLFAISRGLGLPMPRPYRAPYIPGITVMIPHYGETIIMSKEELFDDYSTSANGKTHLRLGGCKVHIRETVPLIDWLKARYYDEFRAFCARMQARSEWSGGTRWDDYTDEQWEKIRVWASMRMQTLWRTVAGMCLYHPALQCHYDVQRDSTSKLSQPGVWKPSDVFTCMVSMQIYKTFDNSRLTQTNKMFDKFPESLKVAFIDWEDLYPKGADEATKEGARKRANADLVHKRQERRYFSCLIDKNCPTLSGSQKRTPRFRIELPGFPILGDGKSDNQNHAIPFMRGIFCQCIDANQGAYFEQMLLLPCVLGEFRTYGRGVGKAKRIIGLPEHITSDFGSIGDFAAGSEIAFGTISQRSFAVLGGRMHYGHPDIMNKQYMMQQGGVSKATKTINLSEDIFAGMDFTLRGDGRKIKHCEYFHLAKGRDLGFNAVLGFFSKLSNGTGEQILTRQMMRLSHVLQLPEALTFYYAHAGYYITQYLISMAMPLTVFTWLLVLCGDCNEALRAFSDVMCETPAAEPMAMMLSTWYSIYIFFFLIATSLPLFAEIWMERNFGSALKRWLLQMVTCSFLLFIFQAKIIGFYIMAEIRQGGASYVATGRGLPTDRREFVGAPSFVSFRLALQLYGIDVSKLCDDSELHGAVVRCIQAIVSSKAGLEPECVNVELMDRPRVNVEIRPSAGSATIPIKTKVGSEVLGSAIAEQIAKVQGIRKVAGSHLSVRSKLMDAQTGWRIERVGGLYLDYTQHTYYNAMDLLFFMICVLYVGGYSDAGPYKDQLIYTLVSVGLVIFSWLYAPFIFNPYQFSARYVAADVKAVYGLFFTDGGKNWSEWYERVILKPKRGLAKSITDFDFIFLFFAITAWISLVGVKQQMNVAIYSKDPIAKYTVAFTLVPPFILSSAYCILLPVLMRMVGCCASSKVRFPWGYKRARAEDSSSETSDSDSESADGRPRVGTEVSDVRHTMEDQEVTQAPVRGCCQNGIPLAFSAMVVSGMQIFELFVPLMLCIHAPDRKLFVSGVVLKFFFWKLVLHICEAMLSMKGVCKTIDGCVPCIHESMQLLVYANQMSRDIFVSMFIFLTLSPVVVLTALNDLCCPTMSLHQALIYRAPGPFKKSTDDDDGFGSSDEEMSSSGSDSDSSSGSPLRGSRLSGTLPGGVRAFRVQ